LVVKVPQIVAIDGKGPILVVPSQGSRHDSSGFDWCNEGKLRLKVERVQGEFSLIEVCRNKAIEQIEIRSLIYVEMRIPSPPSRSKLRSVQIWPLVSQQKSRSHASQPLWSLEYSIPE
jgi:hypothetical protein